MSKQPKQTKEYLLVELTKAKESVIRWSEADEAQRMEFKKAFGWSNSGPKYYFSRERLTPTWTEIFVEIGKLKANREFRDFEGNLSELEIRVKELEPKEEIYTTPQFTSLIKK